MMTKNRQDWIRLFLSTQHDPDVTREQIHEDIQKHVFDGSPATELVDENTKFFVNPTGRFVIGGPHGRRTDRT